MSNQQSPPPERDRREMRRQRGRDRRDLVWGRNGAWIGGVLLIALGVFFLLQNFGYPVPRNWWAVFILVPATGAFSAAWSMYQRNHRRVTPPVTGAAIGGLILTGLALLFFLGLDFGKLWPVILILLGIAALSGGLWRHDDPAPD